MWFLNNIGSLGIMFVLLALLYLIWPFVSCFRRKLPAISHSIESSLYWSLILRTVIEAYIVLILCVLINFKSLTWTDTWECFNSALSIAMIFLLVVFPLGIIQLIWVHKSQLENRAFKRKYDSIYAEMKTANNADGIILYISCYYIRRLLLAATAVMLSHVLVVQLLFFKLSAVSHLILVGYTHPFTLKRHNYSEMVNEVSTLLIMYHTFCFTDWIPDPVLQYNIGFSCLVFNFANLGFNLIQLIVCTLIDLHAAGRIVFLKRKFNKNRSITRSRFDTSKTYGQRRQENLDMEMARNLQSEHSNQTNTSSDSSVEQSEVEISGDGQRIIKKEFVVIGGLRFPLREPLYIVEPSVRPKNLIGRRL